ncbi:MAG: hypothetical protein H7Z38_08440 [Rubrivivax sp.]|nr:hypothetical protein [Pyrinomonadaceae bacterium]
MNQLRLRNRFMFFVLALCLIGLFPARARAWGSKGHRIIAQLAWNYLSPTDQEEIKKLLNGEDFISASTWADEIKQKRSKEGAWHFVAIPLGGSFDEHRDCEGDDCLVEQIEGFKKDLAKPKKSASARLEALKYLIHLVGDIHQPLHCAENGDRGGSQTQVSFFGHSSNLHKVWDIDMLERTGLGEGKYVEILSMRGYRIEYLASVAAWAEESNSVAQRYAYRMSAAQSERLPLGLSYYQSCMPALDLQLARAGIRLKLLLEDALKAGRARNAPAKGR